MLKADNICKNFGNITALDNVSFRLKTAEITALLGKNGAGKSTLLKILSGYIEPDSGNVSIDNIKFSQKQTEYLSSIGYVPENTALYGEIMVFDFLRFTAQMRGILPSLVNLKIREIADDLSFSEVLMQQCDTLSKGYKKRIALAAALIANPQILLLDEPTEGLDPLQKQALYAIMKRLAKNRIVLISTHQMEDVEAIADKILFLDSGKLLENCSLSEFKKSSRTGLVDAFKMAAKDD